MTRRTHALTANGAAAPASIAGPRDGDVRAATSPTATARAANASSDDLSPSRRETDVSGRTPLAVEGGETLGVVRLGQVARSLGQAARHSRGTLGKLAHLTEATAKIAVGRSTIAPEPNDRRFADPTWKENALYRRVMQSYLAWAASMDEMVESADLTWREAERARFFMGILVSAAAPTNMFLGNPSALKRAFETGGTSVVSGLRNLVDDIRHNGGLPSQVDRGAFVVGRDLAVTPGAVVHRDEVCEVLQYMPTTSHVRARPVVMIAPQINKYYFMDLAPRRSFIEYAVSRGIQFFAISWRNPGPEQRDWDMDTYAAAVLRAIDVAREITRNDDVNVLGLCAGGILTTTVLNHLAAHSDDRVNAASFGVTLLDFSIPAMVGLFDALPVLSLARWRSGRAGVLDGRTLGSVFMWLRPNDLVWNYWVNNYLLGKRPPAFDVLAWNADQTNLPAALHAQFLEIFHANSLTRPGEFTVLDSPVDLRRIRVETYVTGALTDHLTPWKGCYRTTQLFSGPSTFVLSNAGHIQSLVNPPGNPKAHYFAGPEPGPDPDAWRDKAEARQGTWWEDWAGWMLDRSGEEHRSPARLGSRRHRVVEPAPGSYVRGIEPNAR